MYVHVYMHTHTHAHRMHTYLYKEDLLMYRKTFMLGWGLYGCLTPM